MPQAADSHFKLFHEKAGQEFPGLRSVRQLVKQGQVRLEEIAFRRKKTVAQAVKESLTWRIHS
ncbi:hypothetical protein GCM10023149_29810 [Mucilaginibacter gynuensis]|uniref:Uncharacterized protein n=1 Tax=Mucilaginibacter gynuensis TaxID=1302236 RepID=A0ABP8GM49_9SPHI